MNLAMLKSGMWVESSHGVGKIIRIDKQHNAVLIEHKQDHHVQSIDINEIIEQPQLHNCCERYY